jgi:hypothetical protein
MSYIGPSSISSRWPGGSGGRSFVLHGSGSDGSRDVEEDDAEDDEDDEAIVTVLVELGLEQGSSSQKARETGFRN